jgi:hypothetical protein
LFFHKRQIVFDDSPIRKASSALSPFLSAEDELRPIPSKGWAEMIRKVYEVDPMICARCGGRMKVVAVLTDYAVVDRIIRHQELTFVAGRPRTEPDTCRP